ncbi:MAG: hypothetical protein K0B01_09500 [Syntrophobacterales bacterium]|nr:hypothetical protein [Syntrophobacterales bacterium]
MFSFPTDRYFGLREFAGRNKTIIPVVIGRKSAHVIVLDDDPVDLKSDMDLRK